MTIIPMRDLKNTVEIEKRCAEAGGPVFITKNGYGDLVVMSIEAYEELIETMKVDSAIKEAEKEYNEDGMLYDARDVLPKMRSKYFG